MSEQPAREIASWLVSVALVSKKRGQCKQIDAASLIQSFKGTLEPASLDVCACVYVCVCMCQFCYSSTQMTFTGQSRQHHHKQPRTSSNLELQKFSTISCRRSRRCSSRKEQPRQKR
eukprot:1838848-Amphidinium_carterae.1